MKSQPNPPRPLFHISRNFVEFGTFTAEEIAGFQDRGVLADHDYIRCAGEDHWLPLGLWISEVAPKVIGRTPAKEKVAAPRKRSASTAKAPKKAA